MIQSKIMCVFIYIFFSIANGWTQTTELPIKLFGYFQNQLQYYKCSDLELESTSFNLQQLNIFLQKDLSPNWTSFINVEIINSYSSLRRWGGMNLEEGWIRYRRNKKFNVKFGLLIPTFNNLNEIKNKTPLLPYVIRPLAYESSFSEFMNLEEIVPLSAYLQAYGYLPFNELKFDYACFLGNSPNINLARENGQTGVDTSATVLFGGRFGIRYHNIKTGISFTHDNVNALEGSEEIFGGSPGRFKEMDRFRFGSDISIDWKNWLFEAELISVIYDEDIENININKRFHYWTLGYHLTDKLFLYGSYWFLDENIINPVYTNDGVRLSYESADFEITVPNIGLSYNINDRMTYKAQFAHVDIDQSCNIQPKNEERSYYIEFAVSVIF